MYCTIDSMSKKNIKENSNIAFVMQLVIEMFIWISVNQKYSISTRRSETFVKFLMEDSLFRQRKASLKVEPSGDCTNTMELSGEKKILKTRELYKKQMFNY